MLGIELRGITEEQTDRIHLERILNSSIKRLLAAYLEAYPYTYDHVAGFARRLSYSVEELASALDDLTDKNMLVKLGQGTSALYALNVSDGWHVALNDYFHQHPRIPKRLNKIMSALL